jgi:hypothetical protein
MEDWNGQVSAQKRAKKDKIFSLDSDIALNLRHRPSKYANIATHSPPHCIYTAY